ncbi:MAG: hypothetical protein E7662_10985 [Ruminococcaceae bacterium]|nr:hypothetical protein [Oscillospiraceae bacterium]
MRFTHTNQPINEQKFSCDALREPRTEFYPAFSWVWNAPLSREEIRRQLDLYVANDVRMLYILPEPKGFRPTTMPTNMEPDYLTEEYFAMYRFAAEYAYEKGMQLWLYDEGGWPSGSACGQVLKNKPHLFCRLMQTREVPSPYTPGEGALAAFCGGKRIRAGFESDAPITEFYHTPALTPALINYPNISDAEAVDEFIRLTHEQYKKHIGHMFGKSITAVFTDEPKTGLLGYPQGFEEKFRERYGYDLLDHLPELIVDTALDADEAGEKVRIDYTDLLAEVFAENYFLKCRTWCRENRMLFTGHLNGEDATLRKGAGYHHIMRQMRCFDMPGIDTIWRQIFPGQKNHFFPRFASSAGNQTGNPYTMSESFSIYGAGLTFDQMRYIMLYQMSRGISMINIMLMSFSFDGIFRKEARPAFMPLLPTWKHLRDYCGYTARMSWLMSLGVPENRCAVYMPMRDLWAGGSHARAAANSFDSAVYALEAQHSPCDIIEDDFLETARIENGALVTGTAAYTAVVIPSHVNVTGTSRQVLDAFRSAGGLVVDAEEIAQVERGADITGVKVSLAKRRLENGMLCLVTNEHTDTDTVCIAFRERGNIYEIDAMHSRLYTYDGSPLMLTPGEGRVFFITDEEYAAEPRPAFCGGEIIVSDFEIRRESAFVIGEYTFEKHEISEEFRAAKPGDWCDLYGESFSGTVLYRIKFTLDEIPDAIEIDLGKVGYSCDLTLNGNFVDSICFSPYRCTAGRSMLREENELIVRICNTPANQYTAAAWLDEVPRNILGQYHDIAKNFERDTLASGLMSPVIIRY